MNYIYRRPMGGILMAANLSRLLQMCHLPSFTIGFVITMSFNKADFELTGSPNSFYLN
jgi:hypothetical protein